MDIALSFNIVLFSSFWTFLFFYVFDTTNGYLQPSLSKRCWSNNCSMTSLNPTMLFSTLYFSLYMSSFFLEEKFFLLAFWYNDLQFSASLTCFCHHSRIILLFFDIKFWNSFESCTVLSVITLSTLHTPWRLSNSHLVVHYLPTKIRIISPTLIFFLKS